MSEQPTPITDAAKAPFCPGRFFVFSEVSENLERQLAEANEKIQGLQDGIEYATNALKRIAECEDAPDIDIGGEAQFGLHCGVEDQSCIDRYEGADYGYSRGVEAALEWAVNEAKHALDSLPNAKGDAPGAIQTP